MQGQYGVAADAALTQVIEDGVCPGPVLDAAELRVEPAGRDQPDQRCQVLVVAEKTIKKIGS